MCQPVQPWPVAANGRQDRVLRAVQGASHAGVDPYRILSRLCVVTQGKPLANAGKEWTEPDDAKLLELAEYYDVNFGGELGER